MYWRHSLRALCALVLSAWLAAGSAALAAHDTGDRHAGYYYPEPQTHELFRARVETLPQAGRSLRVGFVTGVTTQLLNKPYPPTAAIFAKGAEGEKLIIVALEDGRIDTIFRARAIFANLTAVARLTPIVQEVGGEDSLTFFDLAKMLGFSQITITDGRAFSHQVVVE
jgi:hypothetical protein